MTRISALWHLQTLDQERDEKHHRAEQIAHALANDPKLAAARTALAAESDRLSQLRAELQNAELETKSLDGKIKELEARLASGRVTNPKELDALEKERQMHLRQSSALDSRSLELMDTIERTQKLAQEKNGALKKTEAAHETDAQKLARERDTITTRLAELAAEIANQRAALDPDALGAYDRLRQTKGGRAISRLKNGVCAACGMQIPSGVESRLENDEELVPCPNCARILAN